MLCYAEIRGGVMVHITFAPTFPAVFTLILDKLNNCPKFPIGDLRITGELFIKYPIPHLGTFKIADFNNHNSTYLWSFGKDIS